MITHSLRFADLLRATRQTKPRLLGATVVALLVVSGCSSEQSASTTVAPAVTEETTTSAAPSSTESTTTTAPPPVSETTTTTAPEPTVATTTAETDATEAALATALEEFSSSWVRCAELLPACDPQMLATSSAGEQLEVSVDVILGANSNGWTVSKLESYRTQLESVEFVNDTTAEVTACHEDGLVVTSRSGELVDDLFSSARTIWTFELIEGAWKATTGQELRRGVGEANTLCDF